MGKHMKFWTEKSITLEDTHLTLIAEASCYIYNTIFLRIWPYCMDHLHLAESQSQCNTDQSDITLNAFKPECVFPDPNKK